jgi:hypothetical protein
VSLMGPPRRGMPLHKRFLGWLIFKIYQIDMREAAREFSYTDRYVLEEAIGVDMPEIYREFGPMGAISFLAGIFAKLRQQTEGVYIVDVMPNGDFEGACKYISGQFNLINTTNIANVWRFWITGATLGSILDFFDSMNCRFQVNEENLLTDLTPQGDMLGLGEPK